MSTSSAFNSRAWKKAHLKTRLTLIATQCRLTRPCHLHVKCRNYFSMRDSLVQYKDSYFHVEMGRFDCALLMLVFVPTLLLMSRPFFARRTRLNRLAWLWIEGIDCKLFRLPSLFFCSILVIGLGISYICCQDQKLEDSTFIQPKVISWIWSGKSEQKSRQISHSLIASESTIKLVDDSDQLKNGHERNYITRILSLRMAHNSTWNVVHIQLITPIFRLNWQCG
jgi:hypothetical protein